MKTRRSFALAILIGILTITLSQCHWKKASTPRPQNAGPRYIGHAIPTDIGDGKAVADTLRTFAKAQHVVNVSQLKTVATPRYIEACGGEDKLRKKLEAARERYDKAIVHDIKLYQAAPTKVFARFSTIFYSGELDEMSDQWLVVVQDKSGSWKVDDIDKKFDPFTFNMP